MNRRQTLAAGIVVAVAGLVPFGAWLAASAAQEPTAPATPKASEPVNAALVPEEQGGNKNDEIIQEFPAGDKMQTAWKVRYVAHNPGPGLVIAGAWFKRSPNDEWFRVLENVRCSEIFVPYNNGTRIYDIGAQGNYSLLQHTQADAGAHGKIINNGLVVRELRDTGPLWKYYKQVRRGQELVLWSTLGASNYNYLIEYSFRCDGIITARLGSTGRNFGNHETTGHMHHGCWRIDMDLGKEHTNNEVFVVKRIEAKGGGAQAKDLVEPFNNGIEGGIEWKAEEFTRVRVQCADKNGQDKEISYELYPLRYGTPRHWQNGEEFTQKDIWVTPFSVNEQYYKQLPTFVKQGREIKNKDVVLWYMSPAYHLPRDEDGVFIGPNGRPQLRGVATVMWSGFELRPRNFFDKTPLYP